MSNETHESTQDVAALVERCCGGDEAAWQRFVERYNGRIACYVLRACRQLEPGGSPAERARDLVQDVYLRLLANDFRVLRAWRGSDEASFVSYLATIVHAVACDEMRRQRSRKRSAVLVSLDQPRGGEDESPISERVAARDADGPEATFAERYEERRLVEALESVCTGANGHRNRLIFQLHVMEGFSAREIADMPVFRTTTANVETVIRRVKERLKSAMR